MSTLAVGLLRPFSFSLAKAFDFPIPMSLSNRARSILIVEDDPLDVILIRDSLATLAADEAIVVCDDGAEAISWLRQTAENVRGHPRLPLLVLVDLRLPRVDGVTVITWIRRQPRLANLPVVAISGSLDPADVENAFAAGADEFLTKPATPAALRHLLREFGVRLTATATSSTG